MRNMYNEELYNMYSLEHVIKVVISRIRLMELVAHVGEMRNS